MKTQRGFFVSTLMLISLIALVLCQSEDDDNNIPQDSYLPTSLPENWGPTTGITEQKFRTSPIFNIIPTSPRFSSKALDTSEPQVEATTLSVEPESTKPPELEQTDFQYRDDITGDVCVRACLRAALEVPYLTYGENGEEEERTATLSLPPTNKARVGGICGNKKNPSRLKVQWGGDRYILKMKFEETRSGDSDNWIVTEVEFSYDTRDVTYFKDAIDAGVRFVRSDPKSEFFESPWEKSYVCDSEDIITLTSDDEADKSILRIEEIQLQGFMQSKTNGTFSEGEHCESDKTEKPTSNVASVAVGATLGCLILIVIIVYAVGRRMGTITDRTGYKAVD